MRKIILSIAAIILILATSLSFIACTQEQTPTQQGAENQTGTTQQGTGEPTVIRTVTAEEWDEAFDLYFKNFTMEYTSYSPDETYYLKAEFLENGGMHQYQVEHGWGEFYTYYNEAEGKWQEYHGAAVVPDWEYDSREAYLEGNYGDDVGVFRSILPSFKGLFDEFTYDEAKGEYIAEGLPVSAFEGTPMNVSFKFEDKKAVKLYFTVPIPDYADCYLQIDLTKYGTTTITYPERITNPTDENVDED